MPRSKRSHEGYLIVDHRASPGITPEQAASGLYVVAPEGKVTECPTYTCSHCHNVVILNPLRTRAREWCAGCDHYICDTCGAAKKAGASCTPLNQVLDQLQSAAVLGAKG